MADPSRNLHRARLPAEAYSNHLAGSHCHQAAPPPLHADAGSAL